MNQESTTSSKSALWLLAIRPKTLPAAVGPVAVGAAVAYSDNSFLILPTIACLVGAILLQIAVNLANDYFDFKNNIDSDERLGPVRVTQSGLIPPDEVKKGMIVCLVLAGLVFFYLSIVGGWPVVCIGIFSLLAALAYSGGPFPLASNGLGELFVFIFFGLVAVCGTYYIQTGGLTPFAILAALPPGLLVTAIMVVNNLRDITTDEKAGKRTLAVILGRKNTILEYRVLLLLSYLVPLVVFFRYGAGVTILLPLLSLPSCVVLFRRAGLDSGRQLNQILARTARLSMLYCLLFAVGLAYGMN
jgi:1,4-dihydroxy-2-naphthoate octaprenyltransferase